MGDNTIKRPLARYHGGKFRLAPWITSHFGEHRTYVEPFGGAASVLLRKPRSYAEVYNDLDGEIVNLFRVCRDQGDEFLRVVSLTPFSRDEFNNAYTPSDDPVEQARRTLVRAGMGFASTGICSSVKTGFRGSATRTGTHPATDWASQVENLPQIFERLKGVVIENRDALTVMEYHDSPSTLHYVDPPYVHATRTWHRKGSTEAYRHEMSDDDHRRLGECLHALSGMVVVSGYANPVYEEVFADWKKATKVARADKAKERTECLWLNGKAQDAIVQNKLEI